MNILRALDRARIPIVTVALTYLLSALIGILMVHSGVRFAIAYRDQIVSKAQSSPILVALAHNNRLEAALLDFAGNLIVLCSNTLSGLGVILPYPFMAYRGWVGGIVSIDSSHSSRLAEAGEAAYYLTTLLLQLLPSVLAGAAGVNLGLSYYRPKLYYQGDKWLGLSKEALRDVLRIYVLVIPLLLIASLWEFGIR